MHKNYEFYTKTKVGFPTNFKIYIKIYNAQIS